MLSFDERIWCRAEQQLEKWREILLEEHICPMRKLDSVHQEPQASMCEWLCESVMASQKRRADMTSQMETELQQRMWSREDWSYNFEQQELAFVF